MGQERYHLRRSHCRSDPLGEVTDCGWDGPQSDALLKAGTYSVYVSEERQDILLRCRQLDSLDANPTGINHERDHLGREDSQDDNGIPFWQLALDLTQEIEGDCGTGKRTASDYAVKESRIHVDSVSQGPSGFESHERSLNLSVGQQLIGQEPELVVHGTGHSVEVTFVKRPSRPLVPESRTVHERCDDLTGWCRSVPQDSCLSHPQLGWIRICLGQMALKPAGPGYGLKGLVGIPKT